MDAVNAARCRESAGEIRRVNVSASAGYLANERTLAAAFPASVQTLGTPVQPHMRDDLLVSHLGKLNQPEALSLRTWVERNIARPGQPVRTNTEIDKSAKQATDQTADECKSRMI